MTLDSYSETQLLALWRGVLGMTPLRTDCSVEATDGIDADACLLPRLRAWYADLLRQAPPELLPVADIASDCQVTRLGAASASTDAVVGAVITLSDRCVRPLEVRMLGWSRPVSLISEAEAAPRLARMASPFAVPGIADPLAYIATDGSLRVFPAPVLSLASLSAVVDRTPFYQLHKSLLSTLPSHI